MDKKVTGQIIGKDETRDAMIDARSRFKVYMDHLQHKKGEFKDIKADNNKERDEIKREQRIAEQFKFTKMTKKADFNLAVRGKEQKTTSVHAIGVPYIDDRDKAKLCAPDKTFEKNGPQWKLQKTWGDILAHSVRQEEDIYDPNL